MHAPEESLRDFDTRDPVGPLAGSGACRNKKLPCHPSWNPRGARRLDGILCPERRRCRGEMMVWSAAGRGGGGVTEAQVTEWRRDAWAR